MVIERASHHRANQSSSRKDYFTELVFLRLGDILHEIATSICIKPQDEEGGNMGGDTEKRQ